jgi:hypothetical protein
LPNLKHNHSQGREDQGCEGMMHLKKQMSGARKIGKANEQENQAGRRIE